MLGYCRLVSLAAFVIHDIQIKNLLLLAGAPLIHIYPPFSFICFHCTCNYPSIVVAIVVVNCFVMSYREIFYFYIKTISISSKSSGSCSSDSISSTVTVTGLLSGRVVSPGRSIRFSEHSPHYKYKEVMDCWCHCCC